MLTNVGYKNLQMQGILGAIDTNTTFEVWTDPTPNNTDTAPTGTRLANNNFPSTPGSVDLSLGKLILPLLTDNAVNATGVPKFVRIIDNQFRAQFTCRMAAAPNNGEEIVITDPQDSGATQLVAGRTFNMNLAIQG